MVDLFGLLWVFLMISVGGFGSFWLVPCFSNLSK